VFIARKIPEEVFGPGRHEQSGQLRILHSEIVRSLCFLPTFNW
jgi:hypothetical protein